jgi:GAF domain-containing protein
MDVQTDVGTAAADDRLAAIDWLARRMERQPDLAATRRAVVDQARRADLGDAVGLLLVRDGTITVGAASDPEVRLADRLQLKCGQGPGVEAIVTRRSYVSDDLRLDSRWRFWGPQAAAAGWRSALSVELVDGDTHGSLTLYSRQTRSFSRDDVTVAEAFAGHAAIALSNAQERLPRSEAARARRLVSRAQDIVMGRLHVDAGQAFSVLRRNASRGNRKVSEVAADVVAGCPLPEYPSSLPREKRSSCSSSRTTPSHG